MAVYTIRPLLLPIRINALCGECKPLLASTGRFKMEGQRGDTGADVDRQIEAPQRGMLKRQQ
jgi:hypothetical protein